MFGHITDENIGTATKGWLAENWEIYEPKIEISLGLSRLEFIGMNTVA